ncbi:condensation domain-containing protein [Polymorphospora rubra]|uniref:condensation domain-containing protein n=1 Tax=Polymorphospora rubra TaxID=338584 RepID=UPI0033DA92A8
MNLDELLAYVANHDVRLTVDDATDGGGTRLHFDAPAGAVTPELVAALRTYRSELLDRLGAGPAPERVEVARGPLSYQQDRMLSLINANPPSATWNVSMRLVLRGTLDEAALRTALDAVVARHEALRSRFVDDGDGPVQTVYAHQPVTLPVVDVTGLPDPDRLERAENASRAVAQVAFDLDHELPLRLQLVRVDAHTWWLMIVVHHVACDGWAVSVMLHDMAAGYRRALAGEAPDRTPPTVQSIDFARWEQRVYDAETRRRRADYWSTALTLEGFALDLPYDRPAPAVPTGRGRAHHFRVPPDVERDVRAFSVERNTTLFPTLAAAMGVLLARLTGQGDVTISLPYANRDRIEFAETVAIVACPLLIRMRTDTTATFADLVDQVGMGLFGGVDNMLPVGWIYDRLIEDAGGGSPPMAAVSFAYQSTLNLELDMPGLTAEVEDRPTGAARTTLICGLVPRSYGLEGYLEYALDRLDPATAQSWMDGYLEVLATACRQPHRPLSELTGLPAPVRAAA